MSALLFEGVGFYGAINSKWSSTDYCSHEFDCLRYLDLREAVYARKGGVDLLLE